MNLHCPLSSSDRRHPLRSCACRDTARWLSYLVIVLALGGVFIRSAAQDNATAATSPKLTPTAGTQGQDATNSPQRNNAQPKAQKTNDAAVDDSADDCPGAGAGEKVTKYTDCRGSFETSFYIGLGIDTFAGSDTLKYLNPGDSGKTHERAIGGFDFAYRLLGDPTPKTSDPRFEKSLWVYGETIHGVRSVDVNCTQNPDIPVCQKSLVQPTNPGNQLYYILRNASSLEGYMGFRYEFLGLQQQADTPANVYFKAQAGFLGVAGNPGSALDMHHLAVGAVATKGKFQDSYLEVGWGRSDTFATARRRRVKVDGYLEREIGRGVSFFTQLFVDTDLGRGSDAIQTYIGFSFDLDHLLQSSNSSK